MNRNPAEYQDRPALALALAIIQNITTDDALIFCGVKIRGNNKKKTK